MAKVAMIDKEKRRARTVARYAERRSALRSIIKDRSATPAERRQAAMDLSQLPRDASPCRGVRRCQINGRPRGVYRKFGLCRNELRKAAMSGYIPGLVKASW